MKEEISLYDAIVSEQILEKLRFAVRYNLPEEALVLSLWPREDIKSIVFNLGLSFFGQKRTHRIVIPKTWWDWFKERWFPGFLLKRFPLEHTEYTIDAVGVLPEISPSIGPVFRFVNARPVKYLKGRGCKSF